MQERLHHGQSVEACGDIVQHDPSPFGEPFHLTDRRRLDDIEPSKKYKAREQRFPRNRNGDQCDELARHFVNDDELRIFQV